MAAMASNIFLMLLVSFLAGRAETVFGKKIELGSSLSLTPNHKSWPSPSDRFAFGFYPQGNGFKVGIWLLGNDNNNTIVWTANRDDPPVASNATLQLTVNGVFLHTSQGPKQLIPHDSNGTVSFASMLDSGNFVLNKTDSEILWQSFSYPTDTLLGGQVLPHGVQLLSSSSRTNQSTGSFQLSMLDDGTVSLNPAYSADLSSDAYWISDTGTFASDGPYYLFLNDTGPRPLCVVDVNLSFVDIIWEEEVLSKPDSNGDKIIYRATVDFDGVFRLYGHHFYNNGKRQFQRLWSPPVLENLCNVISACGFNSYCTLDNNQPSCNCLPGTDFIDPSRTKLGCKRNFLEVECRGGKANEALYNMSYLDSMNVNGIPYVVEYCHAPYECLSSCLEDCYCGAALYDDKDCRKYELPLRYVQSDTQVSCILYIKVGIIRSLESAKHASTPELDQPLPVSKKAIVLIILLILGFATFLCSAVTISGRFIYKIGVFSYKRLLEIGDLGLNEGVTLRIFSYNKLKKATRGFKQEVGKGSFGSVYKGTLPKGRLIAVKRLEKLIEEGEREFQAEMKAIGKTHHRNLVRLLGYCAEGSKRLLVYEYMSNGSLGNFIFGDSYVRPDWDQKRRIALDIARGLLYLHEECEAPIIHCDIKPQNILMDEFLTAKISDFGLAKLLVPEQTRTFTQVRGTRGYVAPEWNKNTLITVKADVYSYGIMLLEIVFCRRSIVVNTMNPEQTILSNWVYKCFVRRELNKLVLGEEVDQTLLENMVKVGLWCIQDEPFLRPSMKSVVLMLEGVTDVAIPPCPSANCM